ncbi:MAG: type II CAAX prenyl endopeptidase Rce1 family protein [Promethearchaeia archaeon]
MENEKVTEKRNEAWKPHWEVAIRNTAGEFEQEMMSRKENAIEFFAVMAFLLADLWLVAYPAVLLGIEWLNTLSIVLLVIGALYLFFVSPNIHKDEFHGWGLGNPVNLFREIKAAEKKKKYTLLAIILGLIIGLTLAVFLLWTEVADFVGIDEETAIASKSNIGGSLLIIILGAVVAILFSTICIRYDNFLSALKTAFLIIIPLAIFMLILGSMVNGLDVFEAFNAPEFALNVFGYIFWGFIQQLLFSSYFGTRIRKGIPPADDLKSSQQRQRRWLVALLNGSFFGLLHIPSWWLLLGTWILGIFLSYVFMEDKNRNLVALGFIHGFLGSMLGWLFSSEEAEGGLDIEMSVGPWNVEYLDISIFILVGILMVLFIGAIIYIYKNWEE